MAIGPERPLKIHFFKVKPNRSGSSVQKAPPASNFKILDPPEQGVRDFMALERYKVNVLGGHGQDLWLQNTQELGRIYNSMPENILSAVDFLLCEAFARFGVSPPPAEKERMRAAALCVLEPFVWFKWRSDHDNHTPLPSLAPNMLGHLQSPPMSPLAPNFIYQQPPTTGSPFQLPLPFSLAPHPQLQGSPTISITVTVGPLVHDVPGNPKSPFYIDESGNLQFSTQCHRPPLSLQCPTTKEAIVTSVRDHYFQTDVFEFKFLHVKGPGLLLPDCSP